MKEPGTMGDVDDTPYDPRRFRETAYDREHRTRGGGRGFGVISLALLLGVVLAIAVWLMVHR